jgi:uncharacterized membrane protein HdeD (DUF308 family)
MDQQTAVKVAEDVKKGSGWLMLLGGALVILGFLAIGAPLVTGVTVTLMIGMLILAGGLVRIVFAFRAQTWGQGLLAFLLGGLGVLAGLVVLARPLFGLATLTLVLATWFFVDGICEIIYAFRLKPLSGWGWTLFSGIVAVLLGVMIWSEWPLSGAWAIGVLVGVKLFFSGSGLFGIGAAARGDAAGVEEAAG